MCGIVGYVGDRDVASVLLVGLERLSYRGYDSSGIAVMSDNELSYWKRSGKIHELSNAIKNLSVQGQLGIGHTRWATHGQPNQRNAHPHLSTDDRVAIVHNGIIENYAILKERLQDSGVIFRSDTDTEVIVHLISEHMKNMPSFESAIIKTIEELEGSFAICVMSEAEPGRIYFARKGSPLVIGVGQDEHFLSSDINAVIPHTKKVIYMDDDQIGFIEKERVLIRDFEGNSVQAEIQEIHWDPESADKGGYDHYMLKEIYEQPAVVRKILTKLLDDSGAIQLRHLRLSDPELARVSRFIIQACGTSWHAGLVAKYHLENYARVVTEIDISSEFRYRHKVTEGGEIVIALSQSGETADTLACLREAKAKFFKVLSFVNSKNSSMDRESDGVVYSYAGQEIGVASTKNYIAQLITSYLFTLHLSLIRNGLSKDEVNQRLNDLKRIPDYIDHVLGQSEKIKEIALKYKDNRDFLFIGRGLNYPTALEGALKLKEISYIHATGYAAGELKHGPIALIDENMPIICICPQSATYDKMISNIQEVKAREGKIIVIATEGDENVKEFADDIIYIPKVSEDLSPILTVIPLQLISYYIALALGCDVDQPRNLAKSVTVE